MSKLIIYFGLIITITCLSRIVVAQQPDLPSEQVEVIKDFDARINKAKIIIIQPQIPDRDTTQRIRNTYTLSPSKLSTGYDPPKIKPLAIQQDRLPDYYPLFLKVGYGTPNSPYAVASYHWFNQENIDVNVFGDYHGANKKSFENQKFSEFNGGFDIRYISTYGAAIKGGVTYELDNYRLYGYDHSIESYPDSLASRKVNQLGLNLSLTNAFVTQSNVNYRAHARYNRLDDKIGYKETEVQLAAGLDKDITEQLSVGADADYLYITPSDTSINNLFNIQVKPFAIYKTGMFKIRAGVNLAHNTSFKLYPDTRVDANIIPGRLIAYAGYQAGLKSNSFAALYAQNPYLSPVRDTLLNSGYQEIFVGAKGAYSIVNYEARLGFEIVDALPIYQSNPEDGRFIDAIYANGNILRLSGLVSSEILKDILVQTGLIINKYSLEEHDKAWHLPSVTYTLGATLKSLENKLRTTLTFTSENGVPLRSELGIQDRLNALLDLSITANYMVTQHIGAFAHLNNLFNNKRERWIQYPSYGLNVKGGVIVRF